MNFVCLWSPAWPIVEDSSARSGPERPELVRLAATLLTSAPRITVDRRGVIWADARGLNARVLANALLELLHDDGIEEACAGVAVTPVAAELAAVRGAPGVTVVEPGTDRHYVGLFPVGALPVPEHMVPLLFGIGIRTCADLARLTREAVEVRLGADAVKLWRLSRADDDRHASIFAPMPRELPHATLDWVDYEVTDPARLLFVINALLESVCDALAALGQGAREMVLEFSLTDRSTHRECLRSSRSSANRQTWMRLIRAALERLELSCAVTGIALRTSRVHGCEVRQSDLFDRGLATADATEHAVSRLMESQGSVVVVPRNSSHHLLERRTTWVVAERSPSAYLAREASTTPVPALTLQISPVPKPVFVETVLRRDHAVPSRFRDSDGWHDIVHVGGPDRISGGRWSTDESYQREYFRCVTRDGRIIWLFRELKQKRWFLHGWWD